GFFIQSYHMMLKHERNRFVGNFDAFLLHDELSVVNEPCYFYQFMEHAGHHNLQYLSETDFSKVFPLDLPAETAEWLREVARDLVDFEQYLDFFRHRSFRRTLLCRDSVTLNRNINPQSILNLYIGSDLEDSNCELAPDGAEKFRSANGVEFKTN